MRLPYLQQFLGNKKIFNARTWLLLSFYGILLLISSCTSPPTSTQKTLEVSPKLSQSLEKEGAQSQLKTPITANSCGTVVSDPDGWINVRSSPTTQAENILRTLDNGTVLRVVGERDGWLQITEPIEGWVASNRTTQVCQPAEENSAESYHQGIEKAQLKRAMQLQGKEKIAALTQAIQLNPNYAEAYYYRGLEYSSIDSSKAVMDYIQALKIDSRTHPYDYDQDALRDYLQVLETSPKQAIDYYRRGVVRHHFNDELGAIADFKQSVRLNPKFAKVYYYLGLLERDRDKKRKNFTQAIQLDPNFVEAYLERGITYSSGLHLTGGLDDFSAAIRINPNLAHAFYLRSAAYTKPCYPPNPRPSTDEQERAKQKELEDVMQAIRLNPDFPQTFCSARPWGDGGWGCNSVDQVPERYTQIIRWNPRLSWGHYSVSELARYEQEKAQRTVEQSTQIIQRDRRNADAYYRRGIAYLKLEKLDSAIADFTEAIRLNPRDAEAYSNRGFAYYRLKRYKEAISDYTQAIQLNSRFANAYFLRGLLHYDMRKHQQAIEDTTQAIRLDPTLSTAYIIRSRARLALGDTQGAEEDAQLGMKSLPSLRQAAGDASVEGGGKPDVYYTRGVSLARRGDKQAAIRTLQQAANLYRSQGNPIRYQETSAVIQRLQR